MKMYRMLPILYCSLVIATLTGCAKHHVTVFQVTQTHVPDGYVIPGDTIEWRVGSPQDPPFDVVVDPGLCNETGPLHVYSDRPARCNVSKQSYSDGTKINVYQYHFESSQIKQGPGLSGGPFYEHVGSCTSCTTLEELLEKGSDGAIKAPQGNPVVAAVDPQVTIKCVKGQLKVYPKSQPVSLNSTVTWYNPQSQDWSITFKDSAACPGNINASNAYCTVSKSDSYSYAVVIGHASAPICKGDAVLQLP